MGNSQSHVQTQSRHYTRLNKLFLQLATEVSGKKTIKVESFEKYFNLDLELESSTSLAKLIFRYVASDGNGCGNGLDQAVFVKQMEHILENGSSSIGQLQIYFRMFSSNHQHLTYQELSDMYKLCHQMWLHLEGADESNSTIHKPAGINLVEVLTRSVMTDINSPVCIQKCIEWMSDHIPCIFNPIHSWLVTLLLHGKTKLQTCLPLQPSITWPDPPNTLLSKRLFWLLSMVLPDYYVTFKYDNLWCNEDATEEGVLGKKWTMLYNSTSDGQSFNRFKHHCFQYSGPTVVLMLIESGPIIVAAIDSNWKESSSPWGKSNCILLQIQQNLQILQRGENMVFLNERVRGFPTGILFGSSLNKPQVSLTIDLMSATLHYKYDTTAHNITRIEVWGCAGLVAKEQQKEQQRWERKQAEKLQKVKLPGKWDENPDRALLEMAGVTKNFSQYGHGQ